MQKRSYLVAAVVLLLLAACLVFLLRQPSSRSAESALQYAAEIEQTCTGLETEQYKQAIDRLAGLGKDSVPGLMKMLDDEDPNIRAEVFTVIARQAYPQLSWKEMMALHWEGAAPEPQRLPWLQGVMDEAYGDKTRLIRELAVEAIRQHSLDCRSTVIEATSDREPAVRALAYRALGSVSGIDEAQMLEVFGRGLQDKSARVRGCVLVCVAHMKLEQLLPDIIALLKDESEAGTQSCIPNAIVWRTVPQNMSDPGGSFEPQVRHLAAYAIQQITGEDFGFTTCYESRDDMDEIVARIKEELGEHDE